MLDTIDVFGFRRPEATRVMTDMLKSTLSCTILKPGRGRCRELGEGLGRTGVQAWCLQGSGVKGCAWSLAVCDFFEVFADTKRPAVCVCVCSPPQNIFTAEYEFTATLPPAISNQYSNPRRCHHNVHHPHHNHPGGDMLALGQSTGLLKLLDFPSLEGLDL